MKVFGYICLCIICVSIIILPIYFGATATGKAAWNNYFHNVQKVDDATNYETLKNVEDTCRAMISSYEADKLVYMQYKDSEDTEERSWAMQAQMRANKTAANYNNYIIKNSYIWKNNVPSDIYMTLEYIEN